MTAPDMLTVAEVARLLRISPNSVRRYLHDAPWCTFGRRRLIRRQALEAWLANTYERRPTPTAPPEERTHERA